MSSRKFALAAIFALSRYDERAQCLCRNSAALWAASQFERRLRNSENRYGVTACRRSICATELGNSSKPHQ